MNFYDYYGNECGFSTIGIGAVDPRPRCEGFEIDEERRQLLCQLVKKMSEAMDRHYENMLGGIQQLSETLKEYREGNARFQQSVEDMGSEIKELIDEEANKLSEQEVFDEMTKLVLTPVELPNRESPVNHVPKSLNSKVISQPSTLLPPLSIDDIGFGNGLLEKVMCGGFGGILEGMVANSEFVNIYLHQVDDNAIRMFDPGGYDCINGSDFIAYVDDEKKWWQTPVVIEFLHKDGFEPAFKMIVGYGKLRAREFVQFAFGNWKFLHDSYLHKNWFSKTFTRDIDVKDKKPKQKQNSLLLSRNLLLMVVFIINYIRGLSLEKYFCDQSIPTLDMDNIAIAAFCAVQNRVRNDRVEKGEQVKMAGGADMILTNTENQSEELLADAHLMPEFLSELSHLHDDRETTIKETFQSVIFQNAGFLAVSNATKVSVILGLLKLNMRVWQSVFPAKETVKSGDLEWEILDNEVSYGKPLYVSECGEIKLENVLKMMSMIAIQGKGQTKFVCLNSKFGPIGTHVIFYQDFLLQNDENSFTS